MKKIVMTGLGITSVIAEADFPLENERDYILNKAGINALLRHFNDNIKLIEGTLSMGVFGQLEKREWLSFYVIDYIEHTEGTPPVYFFEPGETEPFRLKKEYIEET